MNHFQNLLIVKSQLTILLRLLPSSVTYSLPLPSNPKPNPSPSNPIEIFCWKWIHKIWFIPSDFKSFVTGCSVPPTETWGRAPPSPPCRAPGWQTKCIWKPDRNSFQRLLKPRAQSHVSSLRFSLILLDYWINDETRYDSAFTPVFCFSSSYSRCCCLSALILNKWWDFSVSRSTAAFISFVSSSFHLIIATRSLHEYMSTSQPTWLNK